MDQRLVARLLAGTILSATLAWPAGSARAADDAVQVRVGTHPGFSRIVFDWRSAVDYSVEREGDRVRIAFTGADSAIGAAALPGRPPLPIASVSPTAGGFDVGVAQGAAIRHFRLGNRIVLDVLPSAAPETASPPPAPAVNTQAQATPAPIAASLSTARPLPLPPQPPTDVPPTVASAREARSRPDPVGARGGAASPPEASAAVASADLPPQRDSTPRPVAAQPAASPSPPTATVPAAAPAPVPVPAQAPPIQAPPIQNPPNQAAARSGTVVAQPVRGAANSSAVLPFARETGTAVLRRGEHVWVVFDEARTIDLSAFRTDPVFGQAELMNAPAATVLRLRLPVQSGVQVTRAERGIALEIVTNAGGSADPVITEVLETEGAARLMLRAPSPGKALHLADPDTGERLLVGTLREADARVPVARGFAEFALSATQRGIAVLAWSDQLVLRPTAEGFLLSAPAQAQRGLAVSASSDAQDALSRLPAMTRSFDFPVLAPEAMAERLRLLRAEASSAPALARSPARLLLSETMLALGFGAEAQAVLSLAAAEDPATAQRPRWRALSGAAALLAGRAEEARAALADRRLDGTDEITLWRAWLGALSGDPASATAPQFAATWPLLPAYPSVLRDRLAPIAAESMADGGQHGEAAKLIERLDSPAVLALANAMVLEAQGKTEPALAAYQALDAARDRRQRVRGLVRGVELALRDGRIGAPEAAAKLEPLLYAWRGDASEQALRLRAAELRGQAGDWPGALSILRETEALFPDSAATTRPRAVEAFAALFRDGASEQLPAVQSVVLFEENIDLLPLGTAGDQITARVADRLTALDLTSRAAAMLDQVMRRQPERGLDRARTGLRLAGLRLADGDTMGARTALAESDPAQPPASLAGARQVMQARILAASGQREEALRLLEASDDSASLDLRAEIHATGGEWARSASVLRRKLAATVPGPGVKLDTAQRSTLVRLAAASALAGDTESLSALARDHGDAMREGPLSEPFRLIVSDPVKGISDLPRLAADLRLARGIPASLATITPTARP